MAGYETVAEAQTTHTDFAAAITLSVLGMMWCGGVAMLLVTDAPALAVVALGEAGLFALLVAGLVGPNRVNGLLRTIGLTQTSLREARDAVKTLAAEADTDG